MSCFSNKLSRASILLVAFRKDFDCTFISSSGSNRGTPSLANLESTSSTFLKVFSRASTGKRSLGMYIRMLLSLSICERGNEITTGSPRSLRGTIFIVFFPLLSLFTEHLVRTSTV
uniref:Uncharacterized protein n=1 Tax=Arundo donax TaxID=35708 RepID=A0A0A9CFD9_ARUDO